MMRRVVIGLTAALALAAGCPAAAAAAAGGVVVVQPGPAGTRTLGWSIVPSPDPSASFNDLVGVSCASATACTAVGSYDPTYHRTSTLAESWDGTSWSVVPSPRRGFYSTLTGVSCLSASACTAVGEYEYRPDKPSALIESWNGASWSIVPSPHRGIYTTLNGVSCLSATACTAVGGYAPARGGEETLIESWDGTSWSVVPSPSPSAGVNSLNGVSCASATACTAVGGYYPPACCGEKTLIESWDGTTWSLVPSPSPSPSTGRTALDGVSCVSAAACTAVGSYQTTRDLDKTLVEHWDGTTWSIAPSPSRFPDSGLAGVSCASATACTATGYYYKSDQKGLIESWDGTSWSVSSTPARDDASQFSGVSCTSASACTTVGDYYRAGHIGTLIESRTTGD